MRHGTDGKTFASGITKNVWSFTGKSLALKMKESTRIVIYLTADHAPRSSTSAPNYTFRVIGNAACEDKCKRGVSLSRRIATANIFNYIHTDRFHVRPARSACYLLGGSNDIIYLRESVSSMEQLILNPRSFLRLRNNRTLSRAKTRRVSSISRILTSAYYNAYNAISYALRKM